MISTAALASLLGWIAQATVKGSLMILLAAAVTALLGRRADARWRHLLWVLVLVRLAMPAAPESRWSVFNLLPRGNGVITPAGHLEGAVLALTQTREAARPQSVSLGGPAIIPVARWIAAVWLLGVALLGIRTIIVTLRLRRAIASALRCGDPPTVLRQLLDEGRARLGIRRPVAVVESDAVRTPALHGIVHPVLLLPRGLAGSFSIEELRHVILHELWHLRRMDVAVSWVLSAVQTLHWFNPLVWFAASRIREERELACDELALSCLEADERFGYGRTILKLLESFRSAAPIPALVGIVNGKQKMKRRLTMIASFRNRSRFSILFVLVVAAFGAAALTDARGGERHMIMRHADPAALPTIERLGQRVTIETTNASLSEVLTAVSNATGITMTQSPDIAAAPVQQAKFSIKAENVPAHAVLMEALMPFQLGAEPSAAGVTITKSAESCMAVSEGGAERTESVTETEDAGQRKVEKHLVIMNRAHGAATEAGAEALPPGAEEHRVMVRAVSEAHGCTFDANGKLHRELSLTMNENGTDSHGKLTLEISKQ